MLTQWIKDNIPPIERFTPEWYPDDDVGGFVLPTNLNQQGSIQPTPSRSSSSMMKKISFGFKNEEHAVAFKLII